MGHSITKTSNRSNMGKEGRLEQSWARRKGKLGLWAYEGDDQAELEPYGCAGDDQAMVEAGAYETLVVFDWDDTLLCTEAINRGQWSPELLETLERDVQALLRLSARLGETMIVSNGRASWVHQSCTKFMPGLVPLLDTLKVVSARTEFEHLSPDDPFAWKQHAFRRIVNRRGPDSRSGHIVGLNLVVLGDSPIEMEAARAARLAARLAGVPCLLKTVKFRPAPSVPQLIGQVRKVTRELAMVVQDGRNVSRHLSPRDPHIEPLHSSAEAAAWKLSCVRHTERL